MDDDEIRRTLTRLSRPHPSGGAVIERAAILAAGGDFTSLMAWITAHDGRAEAAPAAAAPQQGLHGSRRDHGGHHEEPATVRYVLPPGALD